MSVKTVTLTLTPALLLFISSFSSAQEIAGFYQKNCASCHGRHAEKTAFNKASVLTTLNEAQIAEGLTDRRDGKIQGAGNSVKKRLTDEEIQRLAAYIPTIKAQ